MSAGGECVFCKIVDGSIPTDRVAEGETWLAFRDLNPQAPVHVLVIPKRHVASLRALEDAEVDAHALLTACAAVARSEGVSDDGFRVVANTGGDGGQTVGHLHFHVLGGRPMTWPPG